MFLRCSRCGGQIDAEVGLCATCGLRLGDEPLPQPAPLELDVDSSVTEAEVFAGADDGGTPITGVPFAGELDAMQRALELTGVTDVRHSMDLVFPSLRAGVDPRGLQLSPFEGYLLSLIDGQVSVGDIMEVSGLTLFEAVSAFSSLHEKGIVTIDERSATSAPSPAQAPAVDEPAALSRLALRKAVAVRERPAAVETDPDVLLERAEQAVASADLERARELVRLALVHAPNSERALGLQSTLRDPVHAARRASVLQGLGVRAYQAADYATAVRLLEAALDEHEPLAAVHHRLGLALLRAGHDLVKAETHLRRAVALDPGNDKFRRNLERVQRRRDPGSSA